MYVHVYINSLGYTIDIIPYVTGLEADDVITYKYVLYLAQVTVLVCRPVRRCEKMDEKPH